MKCVILGSAPYMKKWCEDNLKWFVDNDYKIITFNNSWKLVKDIKLISEWHRSTDHGIKGTFLPTKEETTCFKTNLHTCEMAHKMKISEKYLKYNGGTMFLNIMYYILVEKMYYEVVVIGCDMIYTKQGDTFYSDLSANKARNDPLNKYGDTGLNNELEHCRKQYQQHNVKLYNASNYESRLTFDRFTDHLNNV